MLPKLSQNSERFEQNQENLFNFPSSKSYYRKKNVYYHNIRAESKTIIKILIFNPFPFSLDKFRLNQRIIIHQLNIYYKYFMKMAHGEAV